MKGTLARHNSGTKLSALTEETERKKRTNKKNTPTEKTSSGGFNIITQSCLLGFSEDEDSELDLEEDNFPISLNSSISVDQEDGDRKGVEPRREEPRSGNAVQFVGTDMVHYTASHSRPNSSTGTRKEHGVKLNNPKRASSFRTNEILA